MATLRAGRRIRSRFLLAVVAAWLVSPIAGAQKLSGSELVDALQGGGYVLVIRNARSYAEPPADGEESPANLDGEREIDPYGQGEMAALSYAFRELEIPVGEMLTGPAYRSKQSGAYFGFGERKAADELADDADPSWLEQHVTQAPAQGVNSVVVTHGSLISEAFGSDARRIGTADTLIFRPADGRAELVARLTIEDWAKMAVK